MKNVIKLFLVGLVIFTLSLSIYKTSRAADFSIPRVQPGELVSADVMNMILKYIEDAGKTTAVSDITGEWSCTKFCTAMSDAYNPSYYTKDTSGLFIQLNNLTLTIVDDADGTYSYTSSPQNAFANVNVNWDNCSAHGSIGSLYGYFAVGYNLCPDDGYVGKVGVAVEAISDTRTKFSFPSTNYSNGQIYLLCDKTDAPPNRPTDLAAAASGRNVLLTWTDNSSNETGFKVYRKNSLTGTYSLITTTAADATSYTDTVTAAGTYWYILTATNANGDSYVSNAVMLTVE